MSWRSPPGCYKSAFLRSFHFKKLSANEMPDDPTTKVKRWLATQPVVVNETSHVKGKLEFSSTPSSFSTGRKPKSVYTVHQKRKRYRQKKKKMLRISKVSLPQDNVDEGYVTMSTPNTCAPALTSSISHSNAVADSASSSSQDSYPQDIEWNELEREAGEIRRKIATKEDEHHRNYSEYVDTEQVFVFNPTTVDIPKTVNGVDRVLIESKIKNILHNERKAVEHAVLLRDKCVELEHKCRCLETEKEAVRYFLRNRLLEGQSRAARMLKNSLQLKSSCFLYT